MTNRYSRAEEGAFMSNSSHALRADGSHVSNKTLFYFAIPTVAWGFMFCLVNLYYLKFATDILLLSPALIGTIFGISRLWDAVSDPLVGYWSDRTVLKMGRRRPWIAACAIPTALTYLMLFIPNTNLSTFGLTIWVTVGIVGFYSASTLYYVPQMALGAELTDDHHGRNRVFASRHAGWIAGYIIGIGGMGLILTAEAQGLDAVLKITTAQALIIAPIAALLLLLSAWGLRERKEFATKGSHKPFQSIKDVFKNKHARPPLIAYFFDNIGFGFTSVLTIYVADYVLHDALAAPKFLLAFLLPSLLFTPIWMPLARRFGKKNIWSSAMYLSGFSIGGMFFLGQGDDILLMSLGFLAGIANGAGHVIGPSILSDTVDYDELQTGERKEGAYFAAWNFTWKTAVGFTVILVGWLLTLSGFQPNVEQTPLAFITLKVMFSIFPSLAYFIAAFSFRNYNLDEAAHAEIQAKLKDNRKNAKKK